METKTELELAKENLFNQNYGFDINFEFDSKKMKQNFCYKKQPEYIKDYVKKDLNILSESIKKRNEINAIKVGDAVRLKDGTITFISCFHSKTYAQTSLSGSFHLSKNGGVSYSGGFDNTNNINEYDGSLNPEKLQYSGEFFSLPIWFCHQGRLKANCGVNANIKVKLYKY